MNAALEDKASVVLVSRKFRRTLIIRQKADDEVTAVVHPLLKKYAKPMLALAYSPLAEARISAADSCTNACLWLGRAAFDLQDSEVAQVAEAFGLCVPTGEK